MELRNEGRQQQRVFWLASSCCLLVALSVFLLIATEPDLGVAQHAKRAVNYDILLRPRSKLSSAGRSMRGGSYRRGTGSRALALSTGRSLSSAPSARKAFYYPGPSGRTVSFQSARSAGRSMGPVNQRQNQKFREKRAASVKAQLSSAPRSGMGDILGQPVGFSASAPQELAHKAADVTKNTCSCPEEADQQQRSDGDKLELDPEVTNESGAKSTTKNENISVGFGPFELLKIKKKTEEETNENERTIASKSAHKPAPAINRASESHHPERPPPTTSVSHDAIANPDPKQSLSPSNAHTHNHRAQEQQAEESQAEDSLAVSSSTSGRDGGSQANLGFVPDISSIGGGGITKAGPIGETLSDQVSGPESGSLKHEQQDPDEKMASGSRHRNKGEERVESSPGQQTEGGRAGELGGVAQESARKAVDKIEPVSGFKVKPVENFEHKASPAKEDPVEGRSAAGATSPLEAAKEKVFEGLKGKTELKESLAEDKVGAIGDVKENVLEQAKNKIEQKIEAGEQLAGDKIGAKEELAESIAQHKHKKVHQASTTSSTTTPRPYSSQAPEAYESGPEVRAESQEEGYVQAEKPATEAKAKLVHEPAGHQQHEPAVKASHAAAASEPTKYKPVLSHLSPPLYESPTLQKLAPRCQSKLHDLTGVVNEILGAIERFGQRVLVDEHVDYQRRDSLSRKLAIIRGACEESRMAASVNQLRRLNESARSAGVELMRLANSKDGTELDPSLRPLAIKTRKHYVSYRKACKSSTAGQ